MYEKMKKLVDELVHRDSTFMLSFAFTDMFAFFIMFLVYEVPVSVVIGLCTCAGGAIAGIIMTKASAVPGVEGYEALAGKLSYFPVDKQSIRTAQYRLLFKITGIQLLVVLFPLVFMSFRFKFPNALAAVVSTAASMLLVGLFCIEINLRTFHRK